MNDVIREQEEVAVMKVRGYREWAAFGRFVAELPEILAWYTRYQLISQSVKHNGEEYVLILTAVFKGTKYVAFYNGATPILCYTNFYRVLYYGLVKWQRSRF